MLDDMDIIHMNGRIYDAHLGRFLQADPFIQAATNTQNYNRYSYVLNNPLNMIDPSGFNYFKKAWNEIRPFVGAIVAIVATIACEGNTACGSAAWAWIGAASGAAGAAANGGNIAIGALTGILTAGVGGGSGWGNFFLRGFIGGVSSGMMGGKFGHGFISAGIGGAMGGVGGWEGFAASAVVGGTVSEMTGGKFANGAAGAAFVYTLSVGAQKIAEGGVGSANAKMVKKDREEDTNRLQAGKTIKRGNVTYIVEAGTPMNTAQAIEQNGDYYNDNIDKLNDRALTVRVNTGPVEGDGAAAETIRRLDANGTLSYAHDAIEIHVSTKTYSVNEWGSIMGHEMVHAAYYHDNFKYRSLQRLWQDEAKGYQWQIDHSQSFNNPFPIDYLMKQRNFYSGKL